MNIDNLYKSFLPKSTFIADNYQKIIRFNNWINYFGFSTIDIDQRIWTLEPLLETINTEFAIQGCGILKIEPFTNYNWHTDTSRGLTINMLLNEAPSHSLFGFVKDQFNTEFVELKYKLRKFYLFNTQHIHSVINFNEPRYVFTVEFIDNKEQLQYKDVFDWCLQKGLLDE